MSETGNSRPFAYPAILACFLLSGFAALLYETAWLRQFSVVFGTSASATATVLAAYMGGLALGAIIAGRYAGRVRRPVLVYGLLELAIALSALAVPFAVDATRGVLTAFVGGQASPPDAGGPAIELFHLGCGFVVLAIPTACMGATLPLLTRHAVRTSEQIGARVGMLYATNTAGAVLGTLVAAFALLPALGLWGTILVGAAVNAVIFVIASGIARGAPALGDAAIRARRPAESSVELRAEGFSRAACVLPIMLASGAAAFVYEVLWTRLLGHVLGGSVVAFATMLASFLLGITLGSAAAARAVRDRRRAANVLSVAQIGTGLVSIAIYLALDTLPGLAAAAGAGAHAGLAENALIAGFVLLPAAICIGATFPCAVRVLARDESDAARASARVLAWNTFGAIAGAVLGGFVLIPVWGFDGAVRFAVIVNLFLAVGSALLPRRPSAALAGGSVAAAVAVFVAFRPHVPEALLQYSPLTGSATAGTVVHTGVGRSATVTMIEHDGVFLLRTDGMPEARIAARGAPPGWEWTRWLTALPALARPDADNVLVIGFGGGASVSGVPPWLRSIDVIEIEPEVIEANRAIAGRRLEDPLADERLVVITNDARGALALTNRQYDLIVSQPSHPWTAGASHLYTREFLQQARDHLSPDGIFVQWMNSRFVDEALFRTLGATLADAFDNVRLYNPYPDMLIFLASDHAVDPARMFAGDDELPKAIRRHYARLGIRCVEDLAAVLLLDDDGLRRIVEGAPLNTDDRNLMSSRARRAARNALGPDGAARFVRPHDVLLDPGRPVSFANPAIDRAAVVRRLLATDMYERAAAVSAASTGLDKMIASALVARAEGRDDDAETTLGLAMASNAEDDRAGFTLIQPLLDGGVAPRTKERFAEMAAFLTGSASAVVEARQLAELGDWPGIRALDERLGGVRSVDPWFTEAVRHRALWRIRLPGLDAGETMALEAIALIDDAIVPENPISLLLVRLEAARRADLADHEIVETAAVIGRVGDTGACAAARAAVLALAGDDRVPSHRVTQVIDAIGRREKPEVP